VCNERTKLVEQLREMASWGISDQELLADVLRDAADLLEADTGRLEAVMGALDNLRQPLADLAHKQWSGWTEYMLRTWSAASVTRWERQIATEYKDLSESEQDSDRKEADRVLELVRAAIDVAVESEVSGQAGSERDEG